ncbi:MULTISPECIES: L-2-hydroxyglutarate oxidase [unclassified Pseudofrankia]|uniref:L-2-hydroxyglutarate oxidase n=1 Tax=unclassified Pseudofrankia TaxID=2994372 RepID=UPI0008DB046A|nr:MULTISPECIES: L-2-hydroxyglutarate oxidase [unclassified Pseudofrankia]MDT3444694.1 L-2-hydroxyglutarate oxidase [Pseudofrankia sp. BMG5.37]OHV66568.1 hydroxyglutarate oxidase [Pseudofrankia sp. BMG5.36]
MAEYDVAVVGAGIVGLAVALEVSNRRADASIVVVEREADVAAHQTGHNSGVIHGGIYYEPGSLKAKLCVEGAALMYEFAQEQGIAHERCGKLIVAVRPDELPRLDELERRGAANGVPGLRRVSGDEIRDIEPNATGIAALHAPNTGIIDYTDVSRAIRKELEGKGVDFRFGEQVREITQGTECRLRLPHGTVTAKQVIVCAGLWSDRLARRSGAPANPRVVPFRGVYLRLKQTDRPVVNGMVYPVPDPTLPFLGVHVTKHVHGDVMLGPTAMLVPSRDGYLFRRARPRDIWDTVSWPGTWHVARTYWRTGIDEIRMATSKRAYVRAAAQYVPSLTRSSIDDSFHSGVRAQAVDRDGTLVDDFAISRTGAVSHVRNAPSPAATSAFALARELVDRIDRS